MQDDKATAWLTLADADAVEQKVLDVINRALTDVNSLGSPVMYGVVNKLCSDYTFQMRIKGLIEPTIRQTISDEMRMNFKIEHYYEQWNRTAGYRVRYGTNVIQTEQIKIGF